ncbi:Nif3-like dinuclear metal center hexameric protein [Candidatus Margulisiibacteriota bacterium]
MRLNEIISLLEKRFPSSAAVPGDKIGLQVGSLNQNVKEVFVCVDVTSFQLPEIKKYKPDLIICHHPFMHDPIKEIDFDNKKVKMIDYLMKNKIAVYVMHTNADAAIGGLNDYLAEKYHFDFDKMQVVEQARSPLCKLVTFVPKSHLAKLRKALGDVGAGHIGNYSHCTFSGEGIGSFLPLDKAKPYSGEVGKLAEEPEVRLETIFNLELMDDVKETLIKNHPYEEVAYDFYRLYNQDTRVGLGRIGPLKKEIVVNGKKFKHAAVGSGSANEMIPHILDKTKLLICGEVNYHSKVLAREHGITVKELGHYESEFCFVDVVGQVLKILVLTISKERFNKKMGR